jgi:hypothetical protein
VNISACLVTRGDVDMSDVISSLPYDDIVVWDNSKRTDLGIYGRYAALAEAKHDVIYTQDDDVLFTRHDELADAYKDGKVTLNHRAKWDIPWVACGALFRRDLPLIAFSRYLAKFPSDRFFTHYGCDGIFTLLTPVVKVNLGSADLPWGTAPGRVSTSPGWWGDKRDLIPQRCTNL